MSWLTDNVIEKTVKLQSSCSKVSKRIATLKDFSKLSGEYTAQKMKFSIKDICNKCDQIHSSPANLVTFTEEILNGKLRFLCSVIYTTAFLIKRQAFLE